MSNVKKYPLSLRLLHGITALMVLFSLLLGFYLVRLDYYHPYSQQALHAHRLLGAASLLFGLLFIGRRLLSNASMIDNIPLAIWERRLARLAHTGLFLLIAAVPISGILYSQGKGQAIPLFDAITIPSYFIFSDTQLQWLESAHRWMTWVLATTVIFHVGAALKHHFWDNNAILRRML